ncbi:MAG: YbaB/EbfC family nucleoid-associated protein [Spirochaetaceae bacterium]|nr:YbaB/EbfC family nucleoid-associated protein [Spirochaetaceae bacterium]
MNPFEMLKNAQSIKEQLAKVQEELEDLTATGSSGGSIVKVTMNGKFEIQSVYLDPIAVDPRDVPMLQDLIVAASRDAMSKVKEQLEARLGPMMGGLNIPGLNL